MQIAWIGCGVMGSHMLQHLHNGGNTLHIYNRTYEKAKALEIEGIYAYETIADCVRNADVIFTMVGYPKDVEEVYCSEEGIFANAKKNTIMIDMTTSSPTLAKKLYRQAKELGFAMLDSPVSGGDSGAKSATLSIMIGGDQDVYEKVKPLLSLMGTNLCYMGETGNGQHTKACNQIAVAGAVAAMSEAILYAQKENLDVHSMLNAIAHGAAGSWQINNTAPRLLANDFAPGFFIKHFIKDMHIVQEEMAQKDIHLEMLSSVCKMYEELAEQGEENNGTQALIHYYNNSNKKLP